MSNDSPSRIPPRGQPHNTKAARDELSSKNKVEKVREVDADETRKRKFKSFLDDEGPKGKEEGPKPSLFDLPSKKAPQGPASAPLSAPRPPVSSIEGLNTRSSLNNERRDPLPSRSADPLPRSGKFYDEAEALPDQPLPEKKLKKGHVPVEEKKIEITGHAGKKQRSETEGKKEVKKGKEEEEALPSALLGTWEKERGFDTGVKSVPPRVADKEKSWIEKEIEEEEETTIPFFHIAKKKDVKPEKEQEGRIREIAAGSNFSSHIQSVAMQATVQASPYLHPTTAALFFQMVGQIHVMQTSGVSRTEILLNNPSFAGSRFFGATITIEKYATAPDSFNIRLTGSEQAVLSFKQNAASLMSAFQNGNFTFKVNRLDAEYTLERPVYRRKEKGDGKGDLGGGLGGRKK